MHRNGSGDVERVLEADLDPSSVSPVAVMETISTVADREQKLSAG